jgi:non-specific protein-tyrosine kinase
MTLADLVKIVRRWWWVLLITPMIGGSAAYFVSQAITPTYRANTILLIQQTQTPGSPNYQDLLASQEQTGTYSRWVSTTPVLDAAAKKTGVAGGAETLKKKISVSAISNTQLVSISITDPSAARAAAIANAVATVFIDQTKSQQSSLTGSSMEEIQQNIDQVKKQINDTAAQISRLQATPSSTVNQTQITSLQQQLSQFQTTYGTLIESQQRMTIAQAQVSAQVSVLEPATAPIHPVSPRVKLNAVLGGTLGLLLAIAAVAALGYLDNTVKASDDLRALTGAGALGSIPRVPNLDATTIMNQPRSAATEAFRALRTNLQFAIADQGVNTIAVTSTRPSDGKTMTASSLALVLAQGGQRVILVDADLRKPRQHRQFKGLNNRSGLTNLLRGTRDQLSDVLQSTDVPGLRVITSGPIPTNPSDLLSSARMREIVNELRSEADFVLFDTPPVGVSDPLIVAGVVDGVLFVVTSGKSRKNELNGALERMGLTGAPIVGVVLNRVDLHGEGYYYGYRSDVETQIDGSEVAGDKAESGPSSTQASGGRQRGWRSISVGKR